MDLTLVESEFYSTERYSCITLGNYSRKASTESLSFLPNPKRFYFQLVIYVCFELKISIIGNKLLEALQIFVLLCNDQLTFPTYEM